MRTASCLGAFVLLAGCGEGDNITRLRVSGAFEPPALDFGEVPVGLSRSRSVTLVNASLAPFTIDDIEAPSAFSLRGPSGLLEGAVVSAGARIELEVSFVALSGSEWSEPLVIHAGEIDIPLALSARGVERMEPSFTIEPVVLDFGSVEVGSTTRLTFALKNVGNSNGTLTSARPGSGSSDFALDAPWPLTVSPAVTGVFPVAFTPTSPGTFSEQMLIGVGELAEPVAVELRARAGGADGQLFCSPPSVSFGAVERGRSGSQRMSCTARGGDVRVTGSELTGNAALFAVREAPPPSAVAADRSVSYTVDFRAEGLPMRHEASLWIHYTGASGPATLAIPLIAEVRAPPPEANAVSVSLGWDKDFTDVDLHLVRPGGTPFIVEGDCFWASKAPDWGVPGVQLDNPFLDLDDIDGLGPETINLRQTAPGTYGVFVHYFSDRGQGAARATAEINLGGVRVGSYTQSVACNDLWTVGTIEWNGSSGTFSPAGAVTPTEVGNCP